MVHRRRRVLTFVKALNGAYECASDDLAKDVNNGATDGGISNGVLEGAGNLAKKCVDTALQALGKEESHSLSDVLDIIDAIPNFGKTVRESVQFAELGPSAMTGTTTIAGEQFQAFGLTMDNFAWSAGNGQVAITPPLGADEYSALWGVTDGQSRCDVTVNMDSRLDDPDATGNFGFAVAPLSEVQSDQPAGASVQYEHEAPPDFAVAGSFLRPAFLPGGAWQVEVAPVPAPDIYLPRHIQVTDNGDAMTVEIDGQRLATYTHQPECGGVGIRVWGAGFTFTNVRITSS